MATYNLASITKKLYQSPLKLFTLKTLRDILEVDKASSFFNLVSRLVKQEILVKIERNKYMLHGAVVSDFLLANFLYQPSYISFETALNFYGILSQFPYEITSATPKKSQQKNIDNKLFSYVHLKKDLFGGFVKKGEFLIALPEKAIIDQLYLTAKGIKRVNFDGWDFSRISKAELKKYAFRQLKNNNHLFKELKAYLK